jgi:hypothetical protein
MHVHTLDVVGVTITIVSKVGRPFISSVAVLFAELTAAAPNLCMTK